LVQRDAAEFLGLSQRDAVLAAMRPYWHRAAAHLTLAEAPAHPMWARPLNEALMAADDGMAVAVCVDLSIQKSGLETVWDRQQGRWGLIDVEARRSNQLEPMI
jgi:hypothetical protein